MNHDPTDLRALEGVREEKNLKEKHARQEECNDVKWLMKTRQGRRIMWRLLEATGVFRLSYTGDNDTFFREGARNIGLMQMALINKVCPEHYTTMVQEQKDGRSERSSGGTT